MSGPVIVFMLLLVALSIIAILHSRQSTEEAPHRRTLRGRGPAQRVRISNTSDSLEGLRKLLTATIVTNEEHHYGVSFEIHEPQLQTPEYVRLILHYYAKMLFVFDPLDKETVVSGWMLKQMIGNLLSVGITKQSEIFHMAQVDDVAQYEQAGIWKDPEEFTATLYVVDALRRHIDTGIPEGSFTQQWAFSVLALIQASLDRLDRDDVRVLSCALQKMNDAYDSGWDYSEIKSLATVPTRAFLEAIVDA